MKRTQGLRDTFAIFNIFANHSHLPWGSLYIIECFSPIQCAQHILSGSAPVLTTDRLFVTRADTETLNPFHNKIAKVQPCPWTQTGKEAAEETDQEVREDHSLSKAIWPPRTPSEQGKCLPPVVSTLADSSRSRSGLQNKTPPLISSLPLQKRGRYTFD